MEPAPPVLRCRNATQTSVVLEWNPIEIATADVISLSLFRNGQKAGNIPRPTVMQSTKISGLAVDTEYTFHLVLRTSAGTYSSEKVVVKTHKMTDLSGITVTPGILPAQLRESLTRAVERIGAKMADGVRIDTTHFVTTEGRGIAWEKAVEMNIPVVRPEWVEDCERQGRIVGVRGYYLDADPKQRITPRTVISQQTAPEPPRTANSRREAPLPNLPGEAGEDERTNGPNVQEGSSRSVASHHAKVEDADEEDEGDDHTKSVEEQKVRAEDVDRHKVMIPPKERESATSRDTGGSEDDEVEVVRTPGDASFQDIAL